MPILTIITRTFNGRPMALNKNIASVVANGPSDDVQHLIVVDDQKRGVEWAQENLRHISDRIHGDYVMLLDDDDFLIDNRFVELLIKEVKDSPEVVIVKMDMNNGLILPLDQDRDAPPRLGGIACSCYIVRRDVWLEHVADFTPTYDGDFNFIYAVWKHGHPFHWWGRVVSKVGRVSHGTSESSATAAVGVPA